MTASVHRTGLLYSHMLPASVHTAFVNTFYVFINLKPLRFGAVDGMLNSGLLENDNTLTNI